MTNNTKSCTVCKNIKPYSDFYSDKRASDGLYSKCKSCHNLVSKNYKKNNPEKVKQDGTQYREKNKDREHARGKAWRAKYPEKEYQRHLKYYVNNYEKVQAKTLAWQRANPEKLSNYYHSRRAKKLNNGVFFISSKEMNKLYKKPCVYCGKTDDITVDHVIPITRGGRHSIGNLVPACGSCNYSKNAKTITEWKMAKRRAAREPTL